MIAVFNSMSKCQTFTQNAIRCNIDHLVCKIMVVLWNGIFKIKSGEAKLGWSVFLLKYNKFDSFVDFPVWKMYFITKYKSTCFVIYLFVSGTCSQKFSSQIVWYKFAIWYFVKNKVYKFCIFVAKACAAK